MVPTGYTVPMLVNSWYNASMNDKRPPQHKIALSLPRDLWQAMTVLAREHQRSFTKELIWALQEYVERHQNEKK